MDERSQEITAKAMAITLGLVYIFLLILCTWKYISTKDIFNCTWELFLIVAIPASIWWFSRKDERVGLPTMFATGKEVPIGMDADAKRTRKTNYLWKSLAFATAIILLTIGDSLFVQRDWELLVFFPHWSAGMNILGTLSVEFVTCVMVFYGLSYLWGEWEIKRYNRRMTDLEDNDEQI